MMTQKGGRITLHLLAWWRWETKSSSVIRNEKRDDDPSIFSFAFFVHRLTVSPLPKHYFPHKLPRIDMMSRLTCLSLLFLAAVSFVNGFFIQGIPVRPHSAVFAETPSTAMPEAKVGDVICLGIWQMIKIYVKKLIFYWYFTTQRRLSALTCQPPYLATYTRESILSEGSRKSLHWLTDICYSRHMSLPKFVGHFRKLTYFCCVQYHCTINLCRYLSNDKDTH